MPATVLAAAAACTRGAELETGGLMTSWRLLLHMRLYDWMAARRPGEASWRLLLHMRLCDRMAARRPVEASWR